MAIRWNDAKRRQHIKDLTADASAKRTRAAELLLWHPLRNPDIQVEIAELGGFHH